MDGMSLLGRRASSIHFNPALTVVSLATISNLASGEKQVENIRKVVAESIAEDRPWQILLSQTIMSQIKAPLLQETLHLQPKLLRKLSGGALNLAMDEKKAGKEGAEQARMYVGLGKYGVPMNPDAWDGFQAERRKVRGLIAGLVGCLWLAPGSDTGVRVPGWCITFLGHVLGRARSPARGLCHAHWGIVDRSQVCTATPPAPPSCVSVFPPVYPPPHIR